MSYDSVEEIPRDPIESFAKGAVKGTLEWGTKLVKEYASKFRNGKLAFIQDKKTIELVKQQYNSGELAFYKEFIKDQEILFLLKMGLTLRKLDKENEVERKRSLRTKILNKYNVGGLHIAQLVENGILNRYIGILIDDMNSVDKFKRDIMVILENIEKHVVFVRAEDKEGEVIKKATAIILAHSPMIFIISGSGIHSAAKLVKNCEPKLVDFLKDYSLEKISSENKENLFFKRKMIEDT